MTRGKLYHLLSSITASFSIKLNLLQLMDDFSFCIIIIKMDEKKNLLKRINTLLKELEIEDLNFVLKQTEILDYNRTVRLKKAEAEEQKSKGKADSTGSMAETESIPQLSVYIEQTDNSKFFNLCIAQARLFMDYKEIQALYKIAKAAESAKDGTTRIYRWLKKERSDVLAEGNIRGPGSPVLIEIYEALLDTFTGS